MTAAKLSWKLGRKTLAGSLAVFTYRRQFWQLAWPQRLRTERLYWGSVSLLDRVSRRIVPALQAASLRSYVLTVTVTAVTLVATAVAMNRTLPTPRRSTPVELDCLQVEKL